MWTTLRTMTSSHPRRLVASLLAAQLALAPLQAQTGAYCPIVPQTRIASGHAFEGEDVLDMTGGAVKPSMRMRVANASAASMIFIDGETIKDPAALSSLRKSKAQIVLKTEAGAHAARSALAQPVTTVSVLATIPQDARGVGLTYRPETANFPSVVAEYQAAGRDLAALPNATIMGRAPEKETIRQRLLTEASRAQANHLLVVVGHNESGVLKLPDGTSVAIADLASASTNSGRPVLVLSCDTAAVDVRAAGFVTTRPLYFNEIATALKAALTPQRGAKGTTVGGFVRDINIGLASSEKDGSRTRIIAAVALIGAGLLAAVVIGELLCDQQQRRCA